MFKGLTKTAEEYIVRNPDDLIQRLIDQHPEIERGAFSRAMGGMAAGGAGGAGLGYLLSKAMPSFNRGNTIGGWGGGGAVVGILGGIIAQALKEQERMKEHGVGDSGYTGEFLKKYGPDVPKKLIHRVD